MKVSVKKKLSAGFRRAVSSVTALKKPRLPIKKGAKKTLSSVFNMRSLVSGWLGIATGASVFQSVPALAAVAGITVATLPMAVGAAVVGVGVLVASRLLLNRYDGNHK